MNLSPETYDWERIHTQGTTIILLIKELQNHTPETADEIETRLKQHLPEDQINKLTKDDNDDLVVFEFPDEDSSWGTYELQIRWTPTETMLRFKVLPDFGDNRTLVSAPVKDADLNYARKVLAYLFKTKKEAHETAEETFLSEREAEVIRMEGKGYSTEEIMSISDIPSRSNLQTYKRRIEETADEAEEQKQKANRTLDVLNRD